MYCFFAFSSLKISPKTVFFQKPWLANQTKNWEHGKQNIKAFLPAVSHQKDFCGALDQKVSGVFHRLNSASGRAISC